MAPYYTNPVNKRGVSIMELIVIGIISSLMFFAVQLALCFKAGRMAVKLIPVYVILLLALLMMADMYSGFMSGKSVRAVMIAFVAGCTLAGEVLAWVVYGIRMINKTKRVLVFSIAAVIVSSLSLLYCYGGFFIPEINTTSKDTFELTVSDIPQTINVGDTITVTARLRNNSLRFFHVGHGAAPIEIAIYPKGDNIAYTLPLGYSIMPPLGSFTYEATYTFVESGEYAVTIKTGIFLGNREPIANNHVYEYPFDDAYIMVE